MNRSDKEFAARIFNLTMEEVELIHREAVRVNVRFIDVVDDYNVWLQAQALKEPWFKSKPNKSRIKVILHKLHNWIFNLLSRKYKYTKP